MEQTNSLPKFEAMRELQARREYAQKMESPEGQIIRNNRFDQMREELSNSLGWKKAKPSKLFVNNLNRFSKGEGEVNSY